MPAWCSFRDAAREAPSSEIERSPPVRPHGTLRHNVNLRPNLNNSDEVKNALDVERVVSEIMRVPTIRAGAVMPDACPVGNDEIPVGTIIAAEEAIHPGFHSADICCSVAVSMFSETSHSGSDILDTGMRLSHFGGGGRASSAGISPPASLLGKFEGNRFLARFVGDARVHWCSQGDGNHFYYVGRVASTGRLALVTHHGSRRPGAMLYKAGMEVAQGWRRKLCPEAPRHAAWIPSETDDGREYWSALQIIREWTRGNHFAIHDVVAQHLGLDVQDRFWNEHNFVFRKTDGMFYHAKGATPAFPNWAHDWGVGLTLIPLNMAEPILIALGLNADSGLGFAPHGAGRNFSRSEHQRRRAGRSDEDILAEETAGIDARFFCGVPDISELPSAYKDAASLRAQITEFGLAEIVDTIEPVGSIMAGDWQRNAPWRKKKRESDLVAQPDRAAAF